MRIIFLILIFALSLQAKKDAQTCYSIQLASAVANEKNLERLSKNSYPDRCMVMNINDILTVRCECIENFKEAKKSLTKYKASYKQAYIATTLRYRFNKHQLVKVYTSSDEELRLMLQAFLYSNDLEHAYQTALIGYKKHPNSYYWNQKMAEISRWSGRGNDAIKYMKYMYMQSNDSKLAKEIIDYGLKDYQYEEIQGLVEKEAMKNPSKENLDKMTFIYSQIGEPQKAADVLHKLYTLHPKNPEYLTRELQIYMDMGDLESASVIIDIIELKNLYSYDNVKLISYYYYLKRNIQKAYAVLTKVDISKHYDEKLYQLLSDLGWYLQKYKPASEVSQKLIARQNARLVDYERVIYVNKDTNYKLANQTALMAYKKFGTSYLFYMFANNALAHNELSQLNAVIQQIDKSNSTLKEDANYWLIKAKLYGLQNKSTLADDALQHAMQLEPDNMQIQFNTIDLYLKEGKYTQLKAALTMLSSNETLAQSFYFPLASLYYTVHNVNLASYYMQMLQEYENPVIHTMEYKFLQADIYQARNNYNAFMSEINFILKELKKEAEGDPKVTKSDTYLYNYLRAKMYTLAPDSFKQELKEATPYLTKVHYDSIAYAWAYKINAKDKMHKVYLNTKTKEIWLQFADAMQEQNHTQIENLLFSYLNAVPLDDGSFAAVNDGQIALAQTLNFDSLDKNSDNQNAYIGMLGLVKQRSDRADVTMSYYNRDPLLRKYISINNSMYINDGIYFLSDLHYYRNSNLDNNILLRVPNDTLEFNLGAKRLFNKGEITLYGGYANSMDSYFAYSISGKYRLDKYFTLKGGFYKNAKADESVPLLIAGKKDKFTIGLDSIIFNSTSLELSLEKSSYTSQDEKALGEGTYGRAILGHQIRNGYPDMKLSLFGDFAKYKEDSGDKGLLKTVQQTGINVLPNDFYNLGVDFAYGMQNSEIYTRVWRPYFEVSTFYNSDINDFSYAFNAGYGGKLYSQDHLIFGTSYTQSVNGIGGSIFEVFLKYQFLYTHK